MHPGFSRARRAGAWITLNGVTKTKANRGPSRYHPEGRREFHVCTHPPQAPSASVETLDGKFDVLTIPVSDVARSEASYQR
jgi:hypothetical protein